MKAAFLPFALFAVCACACADSLHDQIEKTDRLVAQAIVKHDMKLFASVLRPGVTSDFKHIESGRSMDFDTMVKQMKAGLAMMPKIDVAKATLDSLKTTGPVATAEMTHEIVGSVKGPDGKPHKLRYVGLTTDTYRREGGKWKLASMSWHDQKQFIDGNQVIQRPTMKSAGK